MHSKYYHIYNRGNNREDLFRQPDNYPHFLGLYEKYILPITETFVWVLMRNHFHLLVRVREWEVNLPN
jgi:putative transposase